MDVSELVKSMGIHGNFEKGILEDISRYMHVKPLIGLTDSFFYVGENLSRDMVIGGKIVFAKPGNKIEFQGKYLRDGTLSIETKVQSNDKSLNDDIAYSVILRVLNGKAGKKLLRFIK